jgi:hypothetical protein
MDSSTEIGNILLGCQQAKQDFQRKEISAPVAQVRSGGARLPRFSGSTPLERPNESGHSPIDVILRVLYRIEVVDASPAKLTVNIKIEVVGQLFVRLNNDVLLFVEEVERVQDCPNSRTMFIGFNPRLLNSAF